MRTLAMAFASQFALAAALSPAALAEPAPDATLRASRNGVALAAHGVRAVVSGSQGAGFEKAEVNLATGPVQARAFRNANVTGTFTGSRLQFGAAVRSPYLNRLGVGDGVTARIHSGPYSLAGAFVTGPAGDSVAGEIAAFDGAVAVQAGHRATGRAVGSTSFAGAHVDFDLMNADVSLRWHVGEEEIADGVRRSSAGGVVIGRRSVLEDGDRLRAAMSRPVRPELDLEAPDVALSYMMPLSFGRLTCAGGIEPAARTSRVRLSWGMRW